MLKVYVQRLSGLGPSELAALSAELSEDERARADRLLRPERRRESLAAHALKRRAVGEVLGLAPATLRFGHRDQQKPVLLEGPVGFDFNLSHTDGAVVCAVCLGGHVGVDIEREDRRIGPHLANGAFSARELAWLDQQAGGRRGPSVLTLWTLKEAYAKALGVGLQVGFPSVSVSASPPELVDDGGSLPEGLGCTLAARRLVSGHRVAVAMLGEGYFPPPQWIDV